MCKRERDVPIRFSLWKRAERLRVSSLMWNLVSVGGLVRLKLTTRFLVQRKLGGQQLMLRAPSCGTGALQVLKRIEKAKMADAQLLSRFLPILFQDMSHVVQTNTTQNRLSREPFPFLAWCTPTDKSTLPCVQCRFTEAKANNPSTQS